MDFESVSTLAQLGLTAAWQIAAATAKPPSIPGKSTGCSHLLDKYLRSKGLSLHPYLPPMLPVWWEGGNLSLGSRPGSRVTTQALDGTAWAQGLMCGCGHVARAVHAREAPSCVLPATCPCCLTTSPKGQGRGIDRGWWVYWVGAECLWSFPKMERETGVGALSLEPLPWVGAPRLPLRTVSSRPCAAWRQTACAPSAGRPAHSPSSAAHRLGCPVLSGRRRRPQGPQWAWGQSPCCRVSLSRCVAVRGVPVAGAAGHEEGSGAEVTLSPCSQRRESRGVLREQRRLPGHRAGQSEACRRRPGPRWRPCQAPDAWASPGGREEAGGHARGAAGIPTGAAHRGRGAAAVPH